MKGEYCKKCAGEGKTIGFAIPKADYERGATGYELYSCNTVNATYGCEACGGRGALYKDWYLEENPELRETSQEFVIGTGRLLA